MLQVHPNMVRACCRNGSWWPSIGNTKYGKDAGTFDTNNKDEDQALQCWIYFICDIYFTYVTEEDADSGYEGCQKEK